MPPATTGKSSLPAIAANALLVLVSVFAGFLIMEFAVRAAAWAGSSTTSGNREWSSTFEYSVTRHHRLKPGTVYRHAELEYDYLWINNSLGMRDHERDTGISAAKSFRILFLGDSMVQGYGVPLEESMVYLLENRLNEVPRRQRIDVLNAGVFGYSPMLEYLCLQELAPIVQPDLVMVGFFVGNDVGDDHFYRQQAILQDDGSLRFDDEDWPWTYMNELLDSRLESEAKQRAMHDPRFAQELAALWQKVVQRLVRHSRLMAYLAKGAGNRDQRAALEHRSRQERQIAEEYRHSRVIYKSACVIVNQHC